MTGEAAKIEGTADQIVPLQPGNQDAQRDGKPKPEGAGVKGGPVDVPERDRRGILLPSRARVGGIITPQ